MLRTIGLIVLSVAAFLGPCLTSLRATDNAEKKAEPVIAGNNKLALDLYAQLREGEGNLFFSPYSISSALAMTYAGARGETAAEMAKALHWHLSNDRLHPAFAALTKELNGAGREKRGYQLSVANALWGQKGYPFRPEFLKLNK